MILNERNMSKFNENFIKNYDEDSDKGYILEVNVEYRKRFHNFHNNAPFLMIIKKSHKLVFNLYDRKIYVAYIRTLTEAQVLY